MKFCYSFNIPTQTFERGVKECENESSFKEWMTQKAMEMSYCPILSYQRDATATKYCMGIDCELADEAGECLIKQALQCYVSAERTRVAEENERIRKETEMMKTYFAIKKDGTRTPIQFDNPISEVKTSNIETGIGY